MNASTSRLQHCEQARLAVALRGVALAGGPVIFAQGEQSRLLLGGLCLGAAMLTVLGGLAEFERELIRTRTSEGRARAVANGVRLGRKPTLTPHQRREAIKRVNAEKETLGEIARSYNVSRWTISRLMN
jgi:DNA invertase Pin-like site-specific DNA recombinase